VKEKLSQGQAVKILDEVDEYYKIAPPPDAFVYVNKQFVDPPKKVVASAGADAKAQASGGDQAQVPAGTAVAGATTQPTDGAQTASGATMQPSGAGAVASSAESEF